MGRLVGYGDNEWFYSNYDSKKRYSTPDKGLQPRLRSSYNYEEMSFSITAIRNEKGKDSGTLVVSAPLKPLAVVSR